MPLSNTEQISIGLDKITRNIRLRVRHPEDLEYIGDIAARGAGEPVAGVKPSRALSSLLERAKSAAVRLALAETIRIQEFLPAPEALMRGDAGRYLDQQAQILIHERHWATLEALAAKKADSVSVAEVVEAVATVHHECTHALSPKNAGQDYGYSRFRDATRRMEDRLAALFLEEAAADVWTRHTLQQFILETGVDRLDSRLQRCAYDVRYLDLVSVLETVILDIGKLAGPSFYDLTQLLAREVPDTRGERFAELVLDIRHQPDKTGHNPLQLVAQELERLFLEFDARVANGDDVGATATARFSDLIVRN